MTLMRYGMTASAALALSAVQAFGATLTIDDFSGEQVVTDAPGLGNVSSSQAAGGIGGFRDLQVTNTQASGDTTDATRLQVTGGALAFSNIDQARGQGIITYDGDDDPTSLDRFGLGGIDLNIGTDPFFAFEVQEFDRNVFIQVDAFDILGNQVSFSETLTTGFNPNLPFSQLVGDAGFDFSQVGALQFFVDSSNTLDSVDGSLASIEVRAGDVEPIPLPASALLLLSSMGGLLVLRSRRRQKA